MASSDFTHNNVIPFPDRGARLAQKVAALKLEVEAWMTAECPSYLSWAEGVARAAADEPRLWKLLAQYEAAGGRIAYVEQRFGDDDEARLESTWAELAGEFLMGQESREA